MFGVFFAWLGFFSLTFIGDWKFYQMITKNCAI